MLDSQKELVVLEPTKRSHFHLLSSFFSKKKASILESGRPQEPHRALKQQVDLETLHLSRQDNPYLKQLERLSVHEETLISFQSMAEKALLLDLDLHQHLVRSPPPQFPQNITHFMYSQANSPKRQIAESLESPAQQSRKAKSLNPIQPQKEMDPGIREVSEYQKSQLIAGKENSRWSAESLPSCYLDLAARKSPVGPIMLGRTLSDSICHWNAGLNH